ncbi:hypothetical protein [Absidia glauca]|uniref:Uncharacterized protein n=1 Tax=Absidia glauca TaxID=4829 RepID=A0A168TBZ0_ABSGL|nr:hypothetical protein [Absidia glauca]
MKFSVNSVLLATGLLALLGATNAQDGAEVNIAVFYQNDEAADIVDYNSCIPLTRQDGLKVTSVALGPPGTCSIYKANDCSGATEGPPKEVFENGQVTPDDLKIVGPTGSLKCVLDA